MKSWAGEHPATAVKCLEGDVSATGFWWCLHCHRISEPIDAGDPYPQCAHCKSRRLEWRAPVEPERVIAVAKALPQWPEPSPGRTRRKVSRLPAEDRDLNKLVREGYWFCSGCKEITKRDEQECCVLCGSSEVEWQEPVELS